MPGKRTKEQKRRTTQRRQEYSLPVEQIVVADRPMPAAQPVAEHPLAGFFSYDVSLIYRDLLKTLGLTAFVLVLLFGIAQYLR